MNSLGLENEAVPCTFLSLFSLTASLLYVCMYLCMYVCMYTELIKKRIDGFD